MSLLPELQVIYDTESKSAAMNMAVDEALLLTVTKPVLRFYTWRQPSLSFGYFGRYSEVAAEASQREIVRRWTGGGIVGHGDDLTYSLILPRQHTPVPSPRETYVKIHGAICAALSARMEVALAHEDAPKVSDACFANAVTADVLLRGQKIAGAAQRRTRAGLLHQGSIQTQLPRDFPATFAALLCERFELMPMSADVLRGAEMIADEKYGTDEWLHRR